MSPLGAGTAIRPCSPSMARRPSRIVPSSRRRVRCPSPDPARAVPSKVPVPRSGLARSGCTPRRPAGALSPREDPRVKIQEADAKSLLVAQGLPVPEWSVAHTAADARAAAERFLAGGASAVVIKAQVLDGGRGKAGGVKLASSADEAERVAEAILG